MMDEGRPMQDYQLGSVGLCDRQRGPENEKNQEIERERERMKKRTRER